MQSEMSDQDLKLGLVGDNSSASLTDLSMANKHLLSALNYTSMMRSGLLIFIISAMVSLLVLRWTTAGK